MTDRTPVEVGSGPETIRVLRAALIGGLLPDTYVSAGALVHTEQVSGGLASVAADEDSPLPVAALDAQPGRPRRSARRTRLRLPATRPQGRGRRNRTVRGRDHPTPRRPLLRRWPRKPGRSVPPLRGIIGAPVLRRDGTLLQKPGYDPATGLYLAVQRRPTAGTGQAHPGAGGRRPLVPARPVPAGLPVGRRRPTGPTTLRCWPRRSCGTSPAA